MAVTTMAVIGAASAVKGTIDANKNAKAGLAAANAQANKPAPTVDINALDAQAREFARRNAADSAALEQQYNPGAAQLRSGSIQELLANLPGSQQSQSLAEQIRTQAGTVPTGASYDSPLLRDAIAKSKADLAMGGQLPQDVRNLVVRNALSRSGSVTGGLDLGRDLSVRDLGLTSLDLERSRLASASQLGGQEAALGQGNATLGLQAQQAGTDNLFNSANFLSNIDSGAFARALAAAQLGQNIAAPQSGLDPGSVVNLAVGNSNVAAAGAQQSAALQAAAANEKAKMGASLIGTGLGFAQNYFNKPKTPAPTYSYTSPTTYGTTGYTPPASNYIDSMPSVFCWVAREVFGENGPEWTQFRDWMLSKGSPELVEFYSRNGEAIAEAIKTQPAVKTLIKHLMIAAKQGA